MTDRRLVAEAIRLYRRYAIEIVEGLGFCPYAERARLDARTREAVVEIEALDDGAALDAVEALADDPRVDVGFVIFPRLDVAPRTFEHWVEALRKAHAARRDGAAVVAIEGFHPSAEPDLSSPERLTPFVRRTPDPTLQLTRLEALARVRRGTSTGTAFFDPDAMDVATYLEQRVPAPLHETIAALNLAAVQRIGVEEVERRLRDILRDRDRAYAAIDPAIVRRFPER